MADPGPAFEYSAQDEAGLGLAGHPQVLAALLVQAPAWAGAALPPAQALPRPPGLALPPSSPPLPPAGPGTRTGRAMPF